MTRLTIAMLTAFFVLPLQSALGDDTGVGAGSNSFEAVAHVMDAENHPDISGVAESTATGVTYSYQPACVRGEGISGPDFYGCGKQVKCGRKGHMFFVWAHYPDGASTALGAQCFVPAEAPVAAATLTAADVLRAFQEIPVPASRVALQPPGGETLVNLDTIFSTEAEPFTRTIGLLGHRVELDITPAEYHWVHGDGVTQVTDWAGRPWQEGAAIGELISHRYEHADGSLQPRVDTTWTARYRVDGGAWQDVGGTVTISGEPYDLAVLSATPRLSG